MGHNKKRRMTWSVTDPQSNVPVPSRRIPVPDVPVLPVLSGSSLGGGGDAPPSLLDVGEAALVASGRAAIALVLRLLDVRPGERVLVPAYHCAAMVDALRHVSAAPAFYRVNDDLSVDLDDIERKLGSNARAVLAVNYFGFAQDLAAIRDLCDSRDVAFIEDCAHAFFGSHADRPLGSFGDYAIGSQWKFFPVRDGGCLVSASRDLDGVEPRRRGLRANLAAALDPIEQARDYGRMRSAAPLMATVGLAKKLGKAVMSGAGVLSNEPAPGAIPGGGEDSIRADQVDLGMTAVSRALVRFAARRRIVERRRRTYERLADALSGLPGARPLRPSLAAGEVPFMFPLWVDDLVRVFPKLEDQAIPMQRFGQFLEPEVDEAACPASVAFSRHLGNYPGTPLLTARG